MYILDFEGNEIKEKKFQGHTEVINDLSIDKNGEYLASCSNDGKVIVTGLFNNERYEYSLNRPAKTVAIDPEYAKNKDRPIVCGGKSGKLTLYKKGWFGKMSDSIIHEGEGDIHKVRWRKNYIVWANDKGVKIFDDSTQQRIAYIARPKDAPRPDMFKCCIDWIEGLQNGKEKLLIGWGTQFKIVSILSPTITKTTTKCEVLSSFEVDFYICGVAPFNENLLILSYEEDENSVKKKTFEAPRPELRILDTKGEELICDALSIKDYQKLYATDYSLEHYGSENIFYILSQGDIVVAKPRDIEDHIKWLQDHDKHLEALQSSRDNEKKLQKITVIEVGEKYLEWLMEKKDYGKAALSLKDILKTDKNLYEKWIYKFIKVDKFAEVIPFIPIENPRLNPDIYEFILNAYLLYDHEKFLQCIESWPTDMYDINHVITSVSEKLQNIQYGDSKTLLNALSKLYSFLQQYDKTLVIYLKLKRTDTFEFIERHGLFSSIRNQIKELLLFDENKTLEMLTNNTEKIPVKDVIDQLKKQDQYKYLNAIFNNVKSRALGEKYHNEMVELYCEFDTEKLLPFLEISNSYALIKAKETCEKYLAIKKDQKENQDNIYRAIVYILGRLGESTSAMEIIIDRLNDVDLAIRFVENQKDQELWESLINYSLNNPKFISGLLDNIGDHIDPISLIKRIPNSMQIDKLKMKLVKIISDYSLQMTLQKGCKSIMKSDDKVLSLELNKKQRKGIKISEKDKCQSCNQELKSSGEDCVIFLCQHSYHLSCFRHEFYGDDQKSKNEEDPSKLFPTDVHCLICHKKE